MWHISAVFLQQALENSGLSVVQPQSDSASRDTQNQTTDGATVENKKVHGPDKLTREKKRSIIKKPIQMPGKEYILTCELSCFTPCEVQQGQSSSG